MEAPAPNYLIRGWGFSFVRYTGCMSKGRALVKTDIVNEVEESMDRADAIIMRHIGRKPISEIAGLIGWKPEEVLRRKSELINSIDVLTIAEKRAKIMYELDEMAAMARERAASTIDEYAAGLLNTSVSAMKTVMVELARMEKQDSDAIERLTQKRVNELLRLMDVVVAASVREIAVTHDLDEAELLEVFQEKLVEEARVLEEGEL